RLLVVRVLRVRLGLRLNGDERRHPRRPIHGARLVVRAEPRAANGEGLSEPRALAGLPRDAVGAGLRRGAALGSRRLARARMALWGGLGLGLPQTLPRPSARAPTGDPLHPR